jgi:hypothetical protein
MTSTSKNLVPTTRPPREDSPPVRSASIYLEIDAGTEQLVSLEIRIAVHSRNVSDVARLVGVPEPSAAKLSDQDSPDQDPEDPEYGPYVHTIFSDEPVRMPRPKRGWQKFGRCR